MDRDIASAGRRHIGRRPLAAAALIVAYLAAYAASCALLLALAAANP